MAEPRISPARQTHINTDSRVPGDVDARIAAREAELRRRLDPARGRRLSPADTDARIARRAEAQASRRRP